MDGKNDMWKLQIRPIRELPGDVLDVTDLPLFDAVVR
jgi:hypothetical protein